MAYNGLAVKRTYGGSESELFGQTQHVFMTKDRLFASSLNTRCISVVDNETGESTSKLGDEPSWEDGSLRMGAGMCVVEEEEKECLLVCDSQGDKIVKFYNNSTLNEGDDTEMKPSDQYKANGTISCSNPNAIAVDGTGNVIVAELTDQSQVSCYDISTGEKKFSISSAGDNNLVDPFYVCVDKQRSRMLVSDSETNSVSVFDLPSTNHILTFGQKELQGPMGLCVDAHGNYVVCDMSNDRLTVYTPDGELIGHLPSDDSSYELMYPMDVCTTSDGDLAVVDGSVMSGWSRVQVLH